MTRRRGLIASGVATVLLLLAMAPADSRMSDTGGPGIVPFELTGGQDRADEILDGAGAAFPLLATIFASCKLAFLALAIAYLLAGLAMRFAVRPIRDI